MPATFGTLVSVTPGTGVNTGASPSITTPASNPCCIVKIGWFHDTVTVTGLTITGFGGTAALVKTQTVTGGTDSHIEIWKITAPTANTSGTVQGNFSASTPFHMTVETWSGADQSDPSPPADSVGNATATSPDTLTPTNVGADDAVSGGAANGAGQDLGASSPNDYLNNNNAPDFSTTHDTANVTLIAGAQVFAKAAVRIVGTADGGGGPITRGIMTMRVPSIMIS